MSENIGIYIHVPFCKSKCAYCDFFSKKGCDKDFDRYLAELVNKIEYWSGQTDKVVSSVYIGGGTPSVLGADRLSEIIYFVKNCFRVNKDAEITAEINPDTGKVIDFKKLTESGLNRISIGMQSAIEKELATLGRIHSANDAAITVERAKDAGIENISLDLMMGIPFQTTDSLKQSIDFCAELGVKHISSYILKIEEGTQFFQIKDSLALPDDDEQAELYLFAVDYLDSLGYKQYEISNFAKDSFESRHNTGYWECGEYIGIGPSAHSFLNGKRFFYSRNFEDFLLNKTVSDGYGGSEEEYVMLSLRLKKGLSAKEYRNRFEKELSPIFFKHVENYKKMGYIESDCGRISFTPKGFLVSNTILSDLLTCI